MKIVLFHRDYTQFKGGHLKVYNYFEHVLDSKGFKPKIYFSRQSKFDDTNPWNKSKHSITKTWEPDKAEVLFLGGMDWKMVPNQLINNDSLPIINLIQHVRHTNPTDQRYEFLSNKAIRICVSPEVYESVNSSKKANGPVFLIPNGINLSEFQKIIGDQKEYDFVIAAVKKPRMGRLIYLLLKRKKYKVLLLNKPLPRRNYLKHILSSRTAIFLPNYKEGFYLPALEAMRLRVTVICPDCIGNRSFCINNESCFVPEYTVKGIFKEAINAHKMPEQCRFLILDNASKITDKYSLNNEKKEFHNILYNINNIW